MGSLRELTIRGTTTVDGEGTQACPGEGHRCVARLGLFSGHPTDGKAPACEGALVGVPEPHRFHDGGEPCGSSDGGSRAAGPPVVWECGCRGGEGGGEGVRRVVEGKENVLLDVCVGDSDEEEEEDEEEAALVRRTMMPLVLPAENHGYVPHNVIHWWNVDSQEASQITRSGFRPPRFSLLPYNGSGSDRA
ncbi:hypothetical protein TcBrA4_0096770 [Trypanosoma cruzi]|nr:hypothetical protein TcBrA4_0096770 [Trypanosoma cruzi]